MVLTFNHPNGFGKQKVEEHCLYSLWYMHMGAPKIWQGISARYAVKFDTARKKCVRDLLFEQSKICDRTVSGYLFIYHFV